MKNIIISIAVILGLLLAFLGGWDILEPIIGTLSIGIVTATFIQTQKAKKAVYSDNGDGEWVVALQVGRPVTEAINKQFGQLDALIDVNAVIGSNTISLPEHYKAIASATYKAICSGQGKNIKVVLSGPVALNFLVGQLVGLHHFAIQVYQFDASSGGYAPVPMPTRDWI